MDKGVKRQKGTMGQGKTGGVTSATAGAGDEAKSCQSLQDRSYWLKICPGLKISGQAAGPPKPSGLQDAERVRQDLVEDGYSKIARGGAVAPEALVDKLHEGISRLVRAGCRSRFVPYRFRKSPAASTIRMISNLLSGCGSAQAGQPPSLSYSTNAGCDQP